MSIEAALRFMKHVQATPELQAQINSFQGRDAIERLVLLAESAGYVFSEEEYRAAVVREAEGELNDEALDDVLKELGLSNRPDPRMSN